MASKAAENMSQELQRAELEAVLRSELFSRAPTLAHLLSYLCEKTFAGESGQIKEYSIAVDVFGRRDSFDQDVDSIVRVQANRLRKRMRMSLPEGMELLLGSNMRMLLREVMELPLGKGCDLACCVGTHS